MSGSPKLTNLQHELLKVFQYDLKEDQLLEIRSLLADYFAKKITDETDHLWKQKNWNNETMEHWLQEHKRTPYKL